MDLSFLQFFLPYFNILGVTIGLSSSPAAVYCAEIAVPKLRGRLTVLTSLAIAVGILMIYTLGFFFPVNKVQAKCTNINFHLPVLYLHVCAYAGQLANG